MSSVPCQSATVALLVLAIVSIGCSGSGNAEGQGAAAQDASDSPPIDNCSLVTDAEATRLAGFELKHDEDSLLGCPFVRPGREVAEFTVEGFRGTGPAKDQFGDPSADTKIHEISGLGDSAAVLVRDEHVNFLVVQKGSRYVRFVTTFLKDMNLGSEALKEAQELALTAVGRIK